MAALRIEVIAVDGPRLVGGGRVATGTQVAATVVDVPSGDQIAEANRPSVPALPTGLDPSNAAVRIKALAGSLYVTWAETQAGANFAGADAAARQVTARTAAGCVHLSMGEWWPLPYRAGMVFNAIEAPTTDA